MIVQLTYAPPFGILRSFTEIIRQGVKALLRYFYENPKAQYSHRERQFAEVTEKYMPMIRRICFSYASSREDFEDLRQDILINVWKGLEGYRGESNFSTWIYRVALNTCVSTLRRRSRNPDTVGLDILKGEIADTDSDAETRENLILLYDAISRLSPIEKAIITMHLDERSYEEIANVVGISQGNVGVRLSRIRKKMGVILQRD